MVGCIAVNEAGLVGDQTFVRLVNLGDMWYVCRLDSAYVELHRGHSHGVYHAKIGVSVRTHEGTDGSQV